MKTRNSLKNNSNKSRGLSVSTATTQSIAGSSSTTYDDASQDHLNHNNSQIVTLHGGHSAPPPLHSL